MRKQFERHRCAFPDRQASGDHRNLRLGKITLMHEDCCRVFARLWGAHACSVLVKASAFTNSPVTPMDDKMGKRKVRCRKMRQPARYKRALPRLQTASRRCTNRSVADREDFALDAGNLRESFDEIDIFTRNCRCHGCAGIRRADSRLMPKAAAARRARARARSSSR